MKSTKEIIEEMEKEFDERFTMQLNKDLTAVTPWATLSEIKDFIKKRTRTLLEAFGEEVIGEDTYHTITDPDRIDAGKKAPHPYNDHRAEQRLKVKEIIEGVGK